MTYYINYFVLSRLFVTAMPEQDPDPHRFGSLDPDPDTHWDGNLESGTALKPMRIRNTDKILNESRPRSKEENKHRG